MSAKSTPTRYGAVAITIHWVTAAGIVVAFALGWLADHADDPGAEVTLLRGHIVFAVSVVVLTLLRILWWIVADRRPEPGPDQPRWQMWTASAVHIALYVIILLMGTSGITTLISSDAVPALMAGAPLPDFEMFLPRKAHGLMAYLLVLLLAFHIGAALYHQFIRRDRLLARMGVG